MELVFEAGKNKHYLEIDDRYSVEIIEPINVKKSNEMAEVLFGLKFPIESQNLKDFVSDSRVLVIVNDATRPTPTETILKAIEPELSTAKELKFIVATGSHKKPDIQELEYIFGEFYKKLKDKIYCHNSKDKSQLIYIGDTKRATPVKINKLAVDSDKIVIINSVEPHYFAGFTGGRKSILPGISSYETITCNHKLSLDKNAGLLRLQGNPVHEDMMDAAYLVKKPIFNINVVCDAKRRIYRVTCGDLEKSFKKAVDHAKKLYCVPAKKKADIVIAITSEPSDINLYQSQKSLENSKPVLKDGGTVILVSECRKGIGGNPTFFELLKSHKSPESLINYVKNNYLLGYHKSAKIAELAKVSKIFAVTAMNKEDIWACFMQPFDSLQEAFNKAASSYSNPHIIIIKDASITVPILSK